MIENSPVAWSERARDTSTSWGAAMWSEAGQADRFAAVLAELDPRPGERLLDYGCGTGALCELVPDGVEYVGYDWAEGMIERARREHQGRTFFDRWRLRRYDLVACVGPFNLPDGWTKSDTWFRLSRLWRLTGRALAVSLYAGDDPDCLRYTEDELMMFAATSFELDDRLAVEVKRWRPNDLLLVLRRPHAAV